jgi:LruC domain-containing protein
MNHPGTGIGVNTVQSAPYVTPDTLRLTILFNSGSYTLNDLNISNFNPFLMVNLNRGVEVHLPNYKPTDLADVQLFGTGDDDSNPSINRYYKTSSNLPWAINLYENFNYPKEKVAINSAHLKFNEWAGTSGVSYPDWYKNLTGYRSASNIYTEP